MVTDSLAALLEQSRRRRRRTVEEHGGSPARGVGSGEASDRTVSVSGYSVDGILTIPSIGVKLAVPQTSGAMRT